MSRDPNSPIENRPSCSPAIGFWPGRTACAIWHAGALSTGRHFFGDGVNVAARLEALAEPGGICVSRVVRDQVCDKLDIAFKDRGERQVKNIARPVHVYRIRI
jgi:class 3 adenylate cyclase